MKSSKLFNIFLAVSLVLFPFARTEGMQSSNYIIEKDSINFSGTDESESASYKLGDTMGEIGTGQVQEKCSSLSFDGNGDYVSEPAVDLSSTNVISISFWAKKASFSSLEVMFELTDNTNNYTTGLGIYVNDTPACNATQLAMNVKGDAGSNYACWNSPSINAWHHYVFIGDKSKTNEVDLYMDGAYQTPTKRVTPDNGNNFGNNPVYLMERGGTSLPATGMMDDVRIYSRALGASEISDLYVGKNISNTGLVQKWGFDEGSGTAAADSSGTGNNGTIYNATFSIDTPSVTCNILNAGYRQDEAAPSGSTISISSPTNVTLSPSFGGIAGGTGNGNAAWTVITSNTVGYQMSIKASTTPALKSGSYTFADYVPGSSSPDYDWSVASSASEFGYSIEGAHTVSKFKDDGNTCATGSGNVSDKCWLGFSLSDEAIATSSLPNDPSGTATTVKFRAEAGSQRIQQDGTYTATIIVTAVAL